MNIESTDKSDLLGENHLTKKLLIAHQRNFYLCTFSFRSDFVNWVEVGDFLRARTFHFCRGIFSHQDFITSRNLILLCPLIRGAS